VETTAATLPQPVVAAPSAPPVESLPPVVAPAPKAVKPKPVPTAKAAPGGGDAALEQVIDASLAEASQCMNRRQYDCVIANANAVLRMASGNRRALDFKRQAKAAQDRALSQIQIQ
jgi:hypothetical protein